MGLTSTSGMPALRGNWRRQIEDAEAELATALQQQATLSAAAVAVAHRIDRLRETIEMRRANLEKFRG